MSLLPLSHSGINNYATCPKQFYHLRIAKDYVSLPGEAAMWGTRVHEALERAVRDKVAIPSDMAEANILAIADRVARWAVGCLTHCEFKSAVRRDGSACDYQAEDAYVRGIDDVLLVKDDKAMIIDYKTGRPVRDSLQLQRAAVRCFAHFPEVEVVTTRYLYTRDLNTTSSAYRRCDFPRLLSELHDAIAVIEESVAHNHWPARPSGLCAKYCPVTSCPYQGPRSRR